MYSQGYIGIGVTVKQNYEDILSSCLPPQKKKKINNTGIALSMFTYFKVFSFACFGCFLSAVHATDQLRPSGEALYTF